MIILDVARVMIFEKTAVVTTVINGIVSTVAYDIVGKDVIWRDKTVTISPTE